MIAKLMQDNVVLKQKTGDGCYSIISRIPHPGIGDPLTNGSLSAAKSKKMWKHNETKQLIDVRMSWQDKFSFAKNHRLFWQQICELLLEELDAMVRDLLGHLDIEVRVAQSFILS